LSSRDDGTLLLGMLKYAAWAGWALFVLSVVAEVVTRLRGLPAPRLGPQQHLATQLVGAVLALAVSVPTVLPATATPVQQSSLSQPAAASTVQLGVPVAAHPVEAKDTSDEELFEEYRVRRGDCLWDIAWNELGEPERWPEIYQASRSVGQADRRRLTDPDLIVTGWVLHIPIPVDERTTHPEASSSSSRSTTAPRPASPKSQSEHDAIVTPLRGRAPSLRYLPGVGPSLRLPEQGPMVETPLNTPVPAASAKVSSLEERWSQAIAEHDRTIRTGRGWRDRLSRP
jgi:hypothetical protein